MSFDSTARYQILELEGVNEIEMFWWIAVLRDDGEALLRIAAELRSWIATGPTDNPDVAAIRREIRRDIATLERVGRRFTSVTPIVLTRGISTRCDSPHKQKIEGMWEDWME